MPVAISIDGYAAEDEEIGRLKEYYFKNDVYDKINNDLSLRILVGHKGVGKSALFKVAMFGLAVDEKELMKTSQAEVAKSIYRVFVDRFQGHGKWDNIPTHRVLATLIRKRPRDLVKLCTLAAREAKDNDHLKIGTEDLDNVFDRYSSDVL